MRLVFVSEDISACAKRIGSVQRARDSFGRDWRGTASIDKGTRPNRFLCTRKETGERNAPPGSLVPTGNLANARLNGARSYWPSRPKAAWLTSVSAIPAQAHVREASNQGGPNVKTRRARSPVLLRWPRRNSDAWSARCFDSPIPVRPCLERTLRLGVGRHGRRPSRLAPGWRVAAVPRDGVCARGLPVRDKTFRAPFFRTFLWACKERYSGASLQQIDTPNLESRTKQTTMASKHLNFSLAKSKTPAADSRPETVPTTAARKKESTLPILPKQCSLGSPA